MKLNEINENRFLYYELKLTEEFTTQDADKIVSMLAGAVGSFTKGHAGTEGMWYDIRYSTEQQAKQGRKYLRRLSRGKPRFNVTFVTVSQYSSDPQGRFRR